MVARQAGAAEPGLDAAALAAEAVQARVVVASAQGSGLWPHSPARPLGPLSTRPCTTMPAPMPVPRMAAKTTSAPAPAPSVASDNARQLASLATRTGCAEQRLQVARQRAAVEAGGVAVLHHAALPSRCPACRRRWCSARRRRLAFGACHQRGDRLQRLRRSRPRRTRRARASARGRRRRAAIASILVPPRSTPMAQPAPPTMRLSGPPAAGCARAARRGASPPTSGSRRSRTCAW